MGWPHWHAKRRDRGRDRGACADPVQEPVARQGLDVVRPTGQPERGAPSSEGGLGSGRRA